MKVKRYLEFTTEGLNDLQSYMRSTGQSQEFNPLYFNKEEKGDIESMGGVVNSQTAELSSGEIITKSQDGYTLEKSGNQLVFVRMSRFKTIPSDWQVFKKQVESYLDI
jgi:hypothetical protein